MGDKANARRTMMEAGVPVVPGTEGTVSGINEARKAAASVGFPVIIKAVAGGGGKGMRVANNEKELETFLKMARAEAQAAFGNGDVYMERYLARPRHVEVQILGDSHGNAIHLGERDCSVQRRHQKLIEESPSPAVDADLRARLGEAALAGARSLGYVGAGTMEFLLDETGEFFFMEMNTRLQVEHPVTEMVTGLDLVAEQLRAAAGETLSVTQDQVRFRGHSFECRINAEDPAHNFRPSPGTITFLHLPGGAGVRLDTHLYQGYRIPTQYDSMIGKLITWGEDRDRARRRMIGALREAVITGLETTMPFHLEVLAHPAFVAGDVNTRFLERLAGEAAEQREPVTVAEGA
jgi:acetyl-CoA carboxylase biotin carboxylase subunit